MRVEPEVLYGGAVGAFHLSFASVCFALVMLWSIFKRALDARQKRHTILGSLSLLMFLGSPWSFET